MATIMCPFDAPMPSLNENVDITFSNNKNDGAYQVTPHSFHLNMARKLVLKAFLDLGLRLVECVKERYSKVPSNVGYVE